MLPVRAQDDPGLPVRREAVVRAAKVDGPVVRVLGKGIVGLLAQGTLQFGENPRHRLRVTPDVGTRPVAMVDALPGPELAVGKTVAGGGGEIADVAERAVEEPMRQRGVGPCLHPLFRVRAQTGEVRGDMARHSARVREARRVGMEHVRPVDLRIDVGKMPREHEIDGVAFARGQRERLPDRRHRAFRLRGVCPGGEHRVRRVLAGRQTTRRRPGGGRGKRPRATPSCRSRAAWQQAPPECRCPGDAPIG